MTTITSTAPAAITANIWPNIIDGREVGGGGDEVLRDSPAHDIRVASYRSASEADVDAAVNAAHRAFSGGDWPQTSGAERATLLRRVASRIESELDELALIETLESGKPISQARDEVASAAGIWYYAASLAQHAYGDAHNDLGSNYLSDNRQGTDWGRRGDHAVELPALDRFAEASVRVWQWVVRPWSSPAISHLAPLLGWSRSCTTKGYRTALSIWCTAAVMSAAGCQLIPVRT